MTSQTIRNVRGFTLLDTLPDLAFSSSDGTHSSIHQYFKGSWGILFSHPDDFTPICTTELGEAARLQNVGEFEARGVKLLGLSCNSVESHQAWLKDIEQFSGQTVNYPIIADESRAVAAELGMLSQDDLDKKGLPLTVRTVFILDPEVRIRLTLTYPASTGRNFVEILRVIDSLQLTDKHKVATPVNWKRGEPVVVASNLSAEDAAAQFSDVKVEELPSGKAYLRFTSQVN
ncbi:hypothetical protein Poli38472_001609 [Pythium oligandrum]|uniref:Thioredoxin domain-containing protein n=1 Tax=Pythium oligandrum TaxID=41045 RepID=A0A8K1CV05_PYTOL|nr:hypothetical protein Poli38472_001609 [Pythium oligandrum]|eukprot:TMW69453.1 hypothetical protein Poli38472_001609 [Pythium oligandrum]